ncbi:MAG: hypothetical protein ACPG4Z_05485 [Chitinophagales bacterium]
MAAITSDDELDAFVSFLLVKLLITNEEKVMILGDENLGSFLLPFNEKIKDKFYESFHN